MGSSGKIISEIVQDIDKHISPYFNKAELDLPARKTGFNQHCGRAKITGSMFPDLVVFNEHRLSCQTLEGNCEELTNKYHLQIKRQSLQERFNSKAVKFLKSVIEIILRQKFTIPSVLKKFSVYRRILLKDSTCFQLPEEMKDIFPGSGGKDSGAAMRIQFEYDILSGSIVDFSITAFNRQDATDSMETIDLVRDDDLIIRDIAYMHKKVLKKISVDREASYISRLDPRIHVYEKKHDKYQRIDFGRLREEMRNKGISIMEKFVYLGEDHSHCCRLIIHTIPQKIEEQRLRKLRFQRKRNGSGEPTEELKEHNRLILIITSDMKIPAEHLYGLYMVRWQIELVFKTWKSVCAVSSIKKVNRFRVECYIYGKLIMMLLTWKITRPLMNYAFSSSGKNISYYKLMKTVVKRLPELSEILIFKVSDIKKYLKNLIAAMLNNSLLDVKKGDKCCPDIIISSITHEKTMA